MNSLASNSSWWSRLVEHWVYGCLPFGVLLLALSPLVWRDWPLLCRIAWLALPAYLLHQYEEHENNRFLAYLKLRLGKGRDVLTPLEAFLVNVPIVWGGIALALWLSVTRDLGFALFDVYLVLINGIVHCVQAIAMREYNPGLITAVVIFIPMGLFGIHAANVAGVGETSHLIGIAAVLVLHIALLVRGITRIHSRG